MKIKQGLILAIFSLGILLSGCMPTRSFDTVIELKTNEDWILTFVVSFDKDSVQHYGEVIKQNIDSSISQINRDSINVSWKQGEENKEGTIPFIITINGSGIKNLNKYIFNEEFITINLSENFPRYVISIPPSFYRIDAEQYSVTIKGGRIISTNGVKINDNTVKWENPRKVLTVIMEKPKVGVSWYIIGVLSLVLSLLMIGASVILVKIIKRSKKKPFAGSPKQAEWTCGTLYVNDPKTSPISPPLSPASSLRKSHTSGSGLRGTMPVSNNASSPTSPIMSVSSPDIEMMGSPLPSRAPKVCPNCNTAWKLGAQFCTNCGHKRS